MRNSRRAVALAPGLAPLSRELGDPDVTDVLVNSDGSVWTERRGRLERGATTLTRAEVALLIESVVAPLGLRADRSSPIVDARLADGSRFNAVLPPLAPDGPCLAIRRFSVQGLGVGSFAAAGVAALLVSLVEAGANLVVSGGTGSGKTTLLNALAAHIPSHERVVTVEDAAELRLPLRHVVRLESRPANAEGIGRVDIRDLVRNALRMRPDRIVVGECRGAEALDVLQALNTGHDGGMSTCHANSPMDALRRFETMCLQADAGLPLPAIREQVGSAIDVVVQVRRDAGGRRAVVEVAEVVAASQTGEACGVRTLADRNGVVTAPLRPARRTAPSSATATS